MVMANEKIKVLVIDDNPKVAWMLREGFDSGDYEILTARDGKDGIKKMLKDKPRVIILDIKMPGMDGMETLKAIKKTFPLVEVIMLTGHATVESAVDGLKSGATDYLMKPTDVKDLIQKAEAAFDKRQVLEEKIRVAQTRTFMKSPREIIRDTE